jgi:hypothetical protein
MDDQQIQARIETLEDEERRLRADEATRADQAASTELAADRDRLAAIKVELDQLWDLLRRRRALRSSGQDPDGAALRDPGTVEGYLG